MQFHFIFTVTCQTAEGGKTSTFEGTITSRPGQTRQDLYFAVLAHVVAESGTKEVSVTFFDLTPNELPALASSMRS